MMNSNRIIKNKNKLIKKIKMSKKNKKSISVEQMKLLIKSHNLYYTQAVLLQNVEEDFFAGI